MSLALLTLLLARCATHPAVAQIGPSPGTDDGGIKSTSFDFDHVSTVPGLSPSASWTDVEGWSNVCLEQDLAGTCIVKGYPGQESSVLYDVSLAYTNPAALGPARMDMNVSASIAGLSVDASVLMTVNGTLGLNAYEVDPDTQLVTSKIAELGISGTLDLPGTIYSNLGMRVEGGTIALLGGTIDTWGGLESNATIRGAGAITGGRLANNGLIAADLAGATLRIDVYGLLAGDVPASHNAGTLRATNGGTLLIAPGQTDSFLAGPQGVIEADADSRVDINASLRGAQLQGAGTIRYLRSSGFLETIRNDGKLDFMPGTSATVRGGLVNNGQIELRTDPAVVAATRLRIDGDGAFSGAGTTILTGARSEITGMAPGATLAIGAGQTVHGAGFIGSVDGSHSLTRLTNNGVIRASQPGAALVLAPGAGGDAKTDLLNLGTLEAAAGGTLELRNVDVAGTGAIRALDGSVVDLNGARVSGAILESKDSGAFRVRGSSSLADLTNRALLNVEFAELAGTLRNYGTLQLHYVPAAGSYAGLGIRGDVVLTGDGVLDLQPNGTDLATAQIRFLGTGGVLTNDVAHTIAGSGRIGDDAIGFVNRGLVLANRSTALTLYGASGKGGVSNQGTFMAAAGSTLSVLANFANYQAATRTLAGGSYDLAGTLRTPWGTSIANNAASILLDGPGAAFIEGPTGSLNALSPFANNLASGSFAIDHGRVFATQGAFTNAGALRVGTGSIFSVGGAGSYTQSAGHTQVDGTLVASWLSIAGGSLGGAGTVQAGLLNAGTLSPGSSPGTLAVQGDFQQTPGGQLLMELAGTAAGSFDHLSVEGLFTLDGVLQVALLGDYQPQGGESFDLFDWESRSGTFGSIVLPPLLPGLAWDPGQLYVDGTLRVTGTVVPLPPALLLLLPAAACVLAGGQCRRAGTPGAAVRRRPARQSIGPLHPWEIFPI